MNNLYEEVKNFVGKEEYKQKLEEQKQTNLRTIAAVLYDMFISFDGQCGKNGTFFVEISDTLKFRSGEHQSYLSLFFQRRSYSYRRQSTNMVCRFGVDAINNHIWYEWYEFGNVMNKDIKDNIEVYYSSVEEIINSKEKMIKYLSSWFI